MGSSRDTFEKEKLSPWKWSREFLTNDDSGSLSSSSSTAIRRKSEHRHNNKSDDDNDEAAFAAKEDQHVFIWRLVVFVVLCLSALTVSLAVYFYLAAEEHNEFVRTFDSDASKVLDGVGQRLGQSIGTQDAFSTKLVQYAHQSNSSWPFVTIPDFAVQARKLLRIAGNAILLALIRMLLTTMRSQWLRVSTSIFSWDSS